MIAGRKKILLRWEEPRAFAKAMDKLTPLPVKWIQKICAFVATSGILIAISWFVRRDPLDWSRMPYPLAALAVLIIVDPWSWLTWDVIFTEEGIERHRGKSGQRWKYSDIASWSVQDVASKPKPLRVLFLNLKSERLSMLGVPDNILEEELRAVFELRGITHNVSQRA